MPMPSRSVRPAGKRHSHGEYVGGADGPRRAGCQPGMRGTAAMPSLYRQLKKLPWAAAPATSAVSTDHGRRVRRTVKAVLAPAWIEFDGAAQVAQLRRTVTKNGRKTVEVVYLITSDRDAGPATLAAWVRSHWEIENRLHWGEGRDLSGDAEAASDRMKDFAGSLGDDGRPEPYLRTRPTTISTGLTGR